MGFVCVREAPAQAGVFRVSYKTYQHINTHLGELTYP